jgi:polysaccharide pyruvyl transferase WcaK-like protein
MSHTARILSIGWFGEGNLGDEAMLEGLLRLLDRAIGPVATTVATGDPAGTARRFGTPVIRRVSPARSGFRNLDLVRASLRADLVTLGGGDLIREQADGTVPALNWLSRLRVPLRLHRRTALLGVSVGELFSPGVIEAVRGYLRDITLIAARDEASAARLAELAGRPVARMGDLALEALEPLPPTAPGRHGVPRIGVATRDIIGRGPSVPASASTDLRSALAAALDRVVDETGARVELVPFRTRPGVRPDDDARAGEALAALARSGGDWIRHDRPDGAAAFGAIAEDLDLVVSVRLHGAVLGAAAGRRVVGIAYDPKVAGFLADLGVPGQAVALDASAGDIAGTVLRSLEDPSLEARIRAGVTAVREATRALEPRLREAVRGR